jgi:VWFA-related protein
VVKKAIIFLLVLISAVPVALWAMQETPTPHVDITGVNATGLPEVLITANVYDLVNQPLLGLTAADFELVGALSDRGQIVDVQNISDDNLPFSVVLAIDISSSMEGLPIERAIEAAQIFVDSIGPTESVAVYTFSHQFNLVQPFTTDKAVLDAAIASIQIGGTTGLYQAAYNTVGLASGAPDSRRVVVLLSDGAEYGGASSVGRGAALQEAQLLSVPVYTIGLGYGADRTFLRDLAEGTNARFFESPNPEQLTQIYADLATLLQSQYIITLNVDVPADGTEYTLALEATTPFGTASDDAVLRAPIPVPLVRAPVFDAPLLEPIEITPDFAADDAIASAGYRLDDGDVTQMTDAPFSFTIDPVTLSPGSHSIEISVTDVDGDTGTVTGAFEVGALPPEVGIVSNLDQTVENVQTVQVNVGGQTPGVSASFQVDDGRLVTDTEAPFAFDIDPMVLSPGAHTLTVVASNEGGESTTVEVPFTVANLAPYVVIVGLEEGDTVDAPVTIEVDIVVTQTPVTNVEILVNGQPLNNREIPPDAIIMSTATLDPMNFTPGPATLTVRATNSSGGVSETELDFRIAALPPVVVFSNLSSGDVLDADQDVELYFLGQTPIRQVEYNLDDAALPAQTSAPWDIPLDVLALGPGPHTLTITATTANGASTTASVDFVISEGPGLTATALVPTATPTATVNAAATQTIVARETQSVESTIAANTQVAQDATATERSVAATGTAEFRATGTQSAAVEVAAQATDTSATQAVIQATRTAVVVETQQARTLAQNTTATAESGARATQTATEATATTAAQATATAQAERAAATTTARQQATATSEAALAATTTEQANLQATQTATEATATTAAQATATAQAERLAATTEARQQATETRAAQAAATATREAVLVAQAASATTEARQTAQAERVNATATAQEAIQATQASATQAALDRRLTQTAVAEQATATEVQATRVAQLAATATQDAAERADALTATASSRQTATAQAQSATATQVAQVTATEQTRLNVQATTNAGATESADATQAGATASARETSDAAEVSTQNAQATADTRATATASVTEEPTQIPPTEEPTLPATPTPRGTLVPVEAESQTADVNQLVPILVVIVAALIVLVVIYLILRGGRGRR